MEHERLDQKLARESIDTVRLLAADAVEKARSGHPGTPMEAAPIAYLLYTRHLRHNPDNPDWPGRDRFLLSCGHASMLLYSMLHLTGYDLSMEDLKQFRQLDSRTPGHPEFGHTPGVETTTGPLGQGVAVGVGMAMGARLLADKVHPELFDYRIYALCSDGDMMEGVAAEAASLAGHLQLGNMIYVYLDNRITIEGGTDLAFSDETASRFLSYGWHVQHVEGENLTEIDAALVSARRDPRPSLIIARTHIGIGAPHKQDTAEAHGAPLGAEELQLTKEFYGRDPDLAFQVPQSVAQHMAEAKLRGKYQEQTWQEHLRQALAANHPNLAAWQQGQAAGIPSDWQAALPCFSVDDGALATRQASGLTLNALAEKIPLLVGGSADLAPSNNTALKKAGSFRPGKADRNIHFGVREHAMGAILNGLAHTPGLIPFGGTFLVFSDYMRPPMRLAAMMGLAPIYVFTHDSIGLGEDGPTHQPVEHLAALRAIPNLTVIRPCDANETVQAWRAALENRRGPTALVLTRQKLPVLDRHMHGGAENLQRGGYVLAREQSTLRVLIIASGSEVQIALEARSLLQSEGYGVRVVSLPSWELFETQTQAYRDEVLPPGDALRVAVEAGIGMGWERYLGHSGMLICMDGFGASAPGGELMKKFGFTCEHLVNRIKMQL
ncbi:transketolase [Syntrophotalea carbinolica DSM 2380]|uniref:Transketolase n=1 Tax=Syntrophotalea carbinolica (strain DSM 2380 / NBRC 103641 / GraBd1) TaxID=338963 RepID=Q39ZU7_SYNC1|nr:transketolase [Syntrophotalea carbinolica]ABA90360.1 transketolase [Syntrophotalea carbinolica DSM 2380]